MDKIEERRTNGAGSRPKFKPQHLAVLAVPVLAVAAAFLLEPLFDRNPSDFRIEGPHLRVLNKHGRILWSFDTELKDPDEEPAYRLAYPEKTILAAGGGSLVRFPGIMIRDLDGDNRKEVLFVPSSRDGVSSGRLLLFNNRGEKKWEYAPGRAVHVGDRSYPSDFAIHILDIRDVDFDGRMDILIGAHGPGETPAHFVVLDMDQRILGEYWNYGRFSDVLVRYGNNRAEIILAGTNNEYGQACLVVLDAADMRGTSPQGPGHRFSGLPEGTARYYLRFQNPELGRLRFARSTISSIRTTRRGHIIAEAEGGLVEYDFDADMNMPQVTVTDAVRAAWRENFQKGLISRPLDPEALRKELEAGVLYYDGASQSWVNRRAGADSRPDLPKR